VTDRDTLLAAVLDDPTDDTARLALGDLFQESDDPDERARGRFLCAGVAAARFRDHDLIDDSAYYASQAELAAVATAGLPALWLSALGLVSLPLTVGDWGWDCTHDRMKVRVGGAVGTFARGMLTELNVTLREWYSAAPAALDLWPLERGSITDVPGLCFEIDPTGREWRVIARLKLPARRVTLGGGPIPATVAPRPVLAESGADWWAEERFPDRAALVGRIGPVSALLVDDLRDAAGDRWPSPPSGRRR